MYGRSAAFYARLFAGSSGRALRDASAEAGRVREEARRVVPQARTLLDVACGAGRYLPDLATDFEITGIDLNPDLVAAARDALPSATFEVADMTEFDLGRRFDIITCLFSSIAYAGTLERMQATISHIATHLEPGGLVIVEPWFGPDTFWDGHVVSNYLDEPDLKVAWMYRQERHDRLSILPIHYLVATPEGVEHFTEQHEMGLFTHEEYVDAMVAVGLDVSHDPDAFSRGLYMGVGPS